MAFPTTSVLDTFPGATPGANWTSPVENESFLFAVTANQCSWPDGDNGGYWNPSTFGPASEVFMDLPTAPAGGFAVRLELRIVSPGGSANGYRVVFKPGVSTLTFQRLDGGVATTLGATASISVANGDSIGADMNGSTLGGYTKTAAVWTTISTRSDATYSAAGNIGHYGNDTSARGDNFGGGTVVVAGPLLPYPVHQVAVSRASFY